MYIATVVGDHFSGKTALCSQWSGALPTNSYVSTIQVDQYYLPQLTINDTPSIERFCTNIDSLYASSDIMIIVSKEDKDYDPWYARISPIARHAIWVLIINGCVQPKRRIWALVNDIRVFELDTGTGENVAATLETIRHFLDQRRSATASVTLSSMEYLWGYVRPGYFGGCV